MIANLEEMFVRGSKFHLSRSLTSKQIIGPTGSLFCRWNRVLSKVNAQTELKTSCSTLWLSFEMAGLEDHFS